MNSVSKPLLESVNVKALLHKLYSEFVPYGVSGVRYYYLHSEAIADPVTKAKKKRRLLIGIESAGHDGIISSTELSVSKLFRAGHMLAHQQSGKSADKNAYHFLKDPSRAYLYKLDVDQSKEFITWSPNRSKLPESLRLVVVNKDDVAPFLKKVKTNQWLDIPILVGDHPVGKITFDLRNIENLSAVALLVSKLHCTIREIGPLLECLRAESWIDPFDEIAHQIRAFDDLKDLFRYATTTLPKKYFSTTYASIFTSIKDTEGGEKLVLRESSFKSLKGDWNKKYYDLPDSSIVGITPWVYKNSRAIRLQSLRDDRLRETQLKNYSPDITWSVMPGRIVDSNIFDSFLAVPILGSSGKAVGVLRFTEKIKGGELYGPRDQWLLERICTEALGGKIESLVQEQMAGKVFENLSKVNSISVTDAGRMINLPAALAEALSLFAADQKKKGFRKAFVINSISPDSTTFSHSDVGGHLRSKNPEGAYSITDKGSLTVYCLEKETTVFVHNTDMLPTLKALFPTAESAIASPINYNRAQYGTMIIVSERLDLDPMTHGKVLSVLASQAGEIYARREIIESLSIVDGLRHDVNRVLLSGIKARVDSLGGGGDEDIARLLEFLNAVMNTYCSARTDQELFVCQNNYLTDLREEIRTAETAASCEYPINCGLEMKLNAGEVRVYSPYLIVILYNLIKNAWSASRGSKQKIKISTNLDGDILNVVVRDYGKGITKRQLEELKCDIYRSPERLTGVTPHGTGLFVSRKIADWHRVDGRAGSVEPSGNCRLKRGSSLVLRIPVFTGKTITKT